MALIGQAGLLGRRDPEVALKVAAAAHAIRVQSGGDFPPLFRERAERVRATADRGALAKAGLDNRTQLAAWVSKRVP